MKEAGGRSIKIAFNATYKDAWKPPEWLLRFVRNKTTKEQLINVRAISLDINCSPDSPAIIMHMVNELLASTDRMRERSRVGLESRQPDTTA